MLLHLKCPSKSLALFTSAAETDLKDRPGQRPREVQIPISSAKSKHNSLDSTLEIGELILARVHQDPTRS